MKTSRLPLKLLARSTERGFHINWIGAVFYFLWISGYRQHCRVLTNEENLENMSLQTRTKEILNNVRMAVVDKGKALNKEWGNKSDIDLCKSPVIRIYMFILTYMLIYIFMFSS